MAVDTQVKRFGMLEFGMLGDLLPQPDGTLVLADWQQFIQLYNGLGAAPAAPAPTSHMMMMGLGG